MESKVFDLQLTRTLNHTTWPSGAHIKFNRIAFVKIVQVAWRGNIGEEHTCIYMPQLILPLGETRVACVSLEYINSTRGKFLFRCDAAEIADDIRQRQALGIYSRSYDRSVAMLDSRAITQEFSPRRAAFFPELVRCRERGEIYRWGSSIAKNSGNRVSDLLCI